MKPINGDGSPGRKPHLPYSKGWRAPWRGDWGGFGDGHTKLAKLAARIEKEYLDIYVAETPGDRRSLWRAAKMAAVAEMQLDRFNVDGKVSVSRTTRPAMVAERILLRLKRKDAVAPLDLARAIQAHQQQANGGTS
jgi:hypothetical protein